MQGGHHSLGVLANGGPAKYALIVVSSALILVLYPFLRKCFAKGVGVGVLNG